MNNSNEEKIAKKIKDSIEYGNPYLFSDTIKDYGLPKRKKLVFAKALALIKRFFCCESSEN